MPFSRDGVPFVDENDFTFGVEFELVYPHDTHPEALMHGGGYGIGRDCFPTWYRKHDGSLRCRHNYEAIEIISPILSGEEGLREVLDVARHLRRVPAHVNGSCGFHVHIGYESAFGDQSLNMNTISEWINRLLLLVTYHEYGLLAATGSRGRINNTYCDSTRRAWLGQIDTLTSIKPPKKDDPRHSNMYPPESGKSAFFKESNYNKSRYTILNTTNVTYGGDKKTVEFRVFAGTLNGWKVAAYIQLALGLCVKAAREYRSAIPWQEKYNPESRYFSPEISWSKELKKLILALGWRRGSQKRYGALTGWDELRGPIGELQRLAAKLDAIGTISALTR